LSIVGVLKKARGAILQHHKIDLHGVEEFLGIMAIPGMAAAQEFSYVGLADEGLEFIAVMRGTGSNDCEFDNVFVPDEFTFDWLNAVRTNASAASDRQGFEIQRCCCIAV
jgi:alkylation response protein AidB-like acyl-CoA dehydrogenase